MTGIEIIAAERQRRIDEEGFSIEHDVINYPNDELAKAAICYTTANHARRGVMVLWPWDKSWWKPTPDDRIRELAKAGTLIAAEIDRLQNCPVYTKPGKHYAFVDRKCRRCDGDGEIGGFDGLQTCPECHGTGLVGSFEEVPGTDFSRIPSALAYRLRITREQRKIGMAELAARFGWSLVHLSDIERGVAEPTEEEKETMKNWIYDEGGK